MLIIIGTFSLFLKAIPAEGGALAEKMTVDEIEAFMESTPGGLNPSSGASPRLFSEFRPL
ncbi:MAG: hypothetical protein ACUVWQ_08155 [Candidatus Aminicenantales bacterium]